MLADLLPLLLRPPRPHSQLRSRRLSLPLQLLHQLLLRNPLDRQTYSM